MLIGIPKEIKNNENRVALTPAGVQSLVAKGHVVLIETNAGLGSGFADADYANQGAKIVATAAEAWAAELVVKVKEPLAAEYGFLREDLLLFTYLHMAAAPELADAMVNAKTTGVAYETVRSQEGHLPLLVPMSEVAGRMAVQIGAHFLTKQEGGSGVLNVTLPYIEALAGKGFRKAINDDEGLRQGVTTYQGHITSKPVAKGLNREYTSIDELA